MNSTPSFSSTPYTFSPISTNNPPPSSTTEVATNHQQSPYRLITIFALLGILSSVTPMPGAPTVTSANNSDTPETNTPGNSRSRQSILSFAVNTVQTSISTTATQVSLTAAQVSKTVQTTLWPSAPTGRAWLPLPPETGWSKGLLFRDDSSSLVAKAVGSAEGTRQPNGGKNKAYFGHVDPGNAVWNIGTFSYQHCGTCSPAEADRRQLTRLKRQFDKMEDQAQRRYGIRLTLEEQLNAIDLANQAPLAALDQGGFIDRLAQAKQAGLSGSDAILRARVYSYKNPVTNFWEAPGLGNTKPRIIRDQARRQEAIARAIQLHKK